MDVKKNSTSIEIRHFFEWVKLTDRAINVLTSPLHALETLFIVLPKQHQGKLYED